MLQQYQVVILVRLNIAKAKNAEQVYIIKSFRDKNGKSTTRIFKKLGTISTFLPYHNNSRDEVLEWAKSEARRYTDLEKKQDDSIVIELSQSARIGINERNLFNGGYLFLQGIFHELKLDMLCSQIREKHNFRYDLSKILGALVCSRILNPSFKLSSYEYAQSFIEKPDFSLQDVYSSLDVLYEENEAIQEYLYRSSLLRS